MLKELEPMHGLLEVCVKAAMVAAPRLPQFLSSCQAVCHETLPAKLLVASTDQGWRSQGFLSAFVWPKVLCLPAEQGHPVAWSCVLCFPAFRAGFLSSAGHQYLPATGRQAVLSMFGTSGHVYTSQDIGSFQQHSVRLLTSLAQCMAPFSLDYTPSLLEQYMQLFCKTARLQLLLRDYPSRLVVQLYTLVWG